MYIIRKYLNSRLYLLTVLVISMAFWLIAYLSHNNIIDSNIQKLVENISLLTFGAICFIVLVFNHNTFYFVPWVIFIPFVFARPFTALEIPKMIYVAGGILVLGIILNLIIYRPALKIGHFFFGLLALAIAFSLGGINNHIENYHLQLFVGILCSVSFVLLYVIVSSSAKTTFKMTSRMFTYLGILLAFELFVYFLIQPSLKDALLSKASDVGWGISNNIALMLLFTIPFTAYLVLTSKNIKAIMYVILLVIECVSIVFTYSRGAMFSMFVCAAVMIPLSIWKAEDRVTTSISIGVLLFGIVITILYFAIFKPNYYNRFIELAFKLDLDNMNGRRPIYIDCINSLKEYPIFGKGVLSTFEDNGTYAWGHSTILQTVRTMGWVGIIAMSFHLGEKYYALFYRPSLWKMIVASSFIFSGLYGLFDVSYYFINYMIPLVFAMAVIECLYRGGGQDEYELL